MKSSNNSYKIISIISAILSICAIISVAVTGNCGGSLETASGLVPMKCYYTMRMVIILSVCMMLVCTSACFAKAKDGKVISMIAVFLFAFAVFITTTSVGIGVCVSKGMSCGIMATVIRCDTVMIMILSILGILFSGDRHKKQKRGF